MTQDNPLVLRLYVTGNTPRSLAAIQNLRKVCDTYLNKICQLEVIDIRQQPGLAREAQIIATPTLIKMAPLPKKLLIGDFSDTTRVLTGLGLAA